MRDRGRSPLPYFFMEGGRNIEMKKNDRKLEMAAKKNERLIKQLEIYKMKLESAKRENDRNSSQFKDLVNEMDELQNQWREAIQDIQSCRVEYEELIGELREMKRDLVNTGLKPPFHVRVFYKIKNLVRR